MESRQHYPDSWYAATAKGARERPSLQGHHSADICVIGGGFTGLSAALHLAERGYSVILLEAGKAGWGASGRNGGQVSGGQRKDQEELEEMVGKDDARKLWDIAEASVETVKSLAGKHKIDCDLTPGVMAACHRKSDVDWYHGYAEKLASEYGCTSQIPLSKADVAAMLGTDRYHGGLLDKSACHIHPLNFALGLALAAESAGTIIYEESAVTHYNSDGKPEVFTDGGSVSCDHVILACNGYLGKLEKRLSGKIMPINNFVIATEPLPEELANRINRDNVAVFDTKFVLDYYRLTPDRRMLWGGGENYRPGFPKDIATFVQKYMLKVYPELAEYKIDHAWGGTLAITLNRMPHFGRLDGGKVFYAQGYSGHGVALATEAGKMIAEAVAGTAERFDLMAGVATPSFPGGTLLRYPGMVAGMMWFALRDRL